MKVVRYHKPKDIQIDTVSDSKLEDNRDAIIKVTETAICGSDLHIYNGKDPSVGENMIVGHEFMGEVVETGTAITNLKQGDRVVVPSL